MNERTLYICVCVVYAHSIVHVVVVKYIIIYNYCNKFIVTDIKLMLEHVNSFGRWYYATVRGITKCIYKLTNNKMNNI